MNIPPMKRVPGDPPTPPPKRIIKDPELNLLDKIMLWCAGLVIPVAVIVCIVEAIIS